MPDENKRVEERFRYPMLERPIIRIEGKEYEVVDLSVSGIKICYDSDSVGIGQVLTGTIIFHDDTNKNLYGKIIRAYNKEVALKTSGISPRIIRAEKRDCLWKGYWFDNFSQKN